MSDTETREECASLPHKLCGFEIQFSSPLNSGEHVTYVPNKMAELLMEGIMAGESHIILQLMKEPEQNKIKFSHKISMEKWKKKNIPQGIAKERYLSHCNLSEVIIYELASPAMFLCYYLLCRLIKCWKQQYYAEDTATASKMKDILHIQLSL